MQKTTGGKTRNRNAERSVRLLESAFLELLAEKPYEKITVTDVTARADLNRGTFYAHFKNMDDLMNTAVDTLTDTLSNLLIQVMDPSCIENPMPVLEQTGNFINANRALLQKLTGTSSLGPLTVAIVGKTRERLRDFLNEEYGERALTVLEHADFIFAGVLWAQYSWLTGEYGARDIHEVNEELCKMIQGVGSSVRRRPGGEAGTAE